MAAGTRRVNASEAANTPLPMTSSSKARVSQVRGRGSPSGAGAVGSRLVLLLTIARSVCGNQKAS